MRQSWSSLGSYQGPNHKWIFITPPSPQLLSMWVSADMKSSEDENNETENKHFGDNLYQVKCFFALSILTQRDWDQSCFTCLTTV